VPADILIYALVAAGLVFWLRNILGTRNGSERQRPNPFTQKPDDATPPDTKRAAPAEGVVAAFGVAPDMAPDPLELPAKMRASITNDAARTGLNDIVRMDRNFNLAEFVTGAQDAFVMIVEAFANGDRALLKSLLSPELYKAFEFALDAREKSGEVMSTEIHAIRRTDVIESSLRDRMALVTLRFVADETMVVKDKDGEILSGNPDRVSETIDVWSFGRDVKSKDPTWFLLATREEDSVPAS
jgi:predicted lipid-binding transport protein (Tim44 family)